MLPNAHLPRCGFVPAGKQANATEPGTVTPVQCCEESSPRLCTNFGIGEPANHLRVLRLPSSMTTGAYAITSKGWSWLPFVAFQCHRLDSDLVATSVDFGRKSGIHHRRKHIFFMVASWIRAGDGGLWMRYNDSRHHDGAAVLPARIYTAEASFRCLIWA